MGRANYKDGTTWERNHYCCKMLNQEVLRTVSNSGARYLQSLHLQASVFCSIRARVCIDRLETPDRGGDDPCPVTCSDEYR